MVGKRHGHGYAALLDSALLQEQLINETARIMCCLVSCGISSRWNGAIQQEEENWRRPSELVSWHQGLEAGEDAGTEGKVWRKSED
jgi:hypothetical protein